MKSKKCIKDHFIFFDLTPIAVPIDEFPHARWNAVLRWYKAGVSYDTAECDDDCDMEEFEISEEQLIVPDAYGVLEPMNKVPPWQRVQKKDTDEDLWEKPYAPVADNLPF